jgi:hypothetical protein
MSCRHARHCPSRKFQTQAGLLFGDNRSTRPNRSETRSQFSERLRNLKPVARLQFARTTYEIKSVVVNQSHASDCYISPANAVITKDGFRVPIFNTIRKSVHRTHPVCDRTRLTHAGVSEGERCRGQWPYEAPVGCGVNGSDGVLLHRLWFSLPRRR